MTGQSWGLTDHVVSESLRRIQPPSVVDYGAGIGKYGKIIRAILPHTHITAVDIFPENCRTLTATGAYDSVLCQDIRTVLPLGKPNGYAAIFGDVLEHLEEREIELAIKSIYKHFCVAFIIVPLGSVPQGPVAGNDAERHRATIEEEPFIRMIERNSFRIIEKYIVSADGPTGEYKKMALQIRPKR